LICSSSLTSTVNSHHLITYVCHNECKFVGLIWTFSHGRVIPGCDAVPLDERFLVF
jgi:hypothetical protein